MNVLSRVIATLYDCLSDIKEGLFLFLSVVCMSIMFNVFLFCNLRIYYQRIQNSHNQNVVLLTLTTTVLFNLMQLDYSDINALLQLGKSL